MKEIWRDIPNYEGYQVSNLGEVRTNDKITHTKRHGNRHWKNRILKVKGQTYKPGYRVTLWKDNEPKDMLVARLVAFTFYNEDINNRELTVNHIDGNRFNNHLDNLELVSLRENIQKGFETGLYSTCKKTKITNKETKEVKEFISMSRASKYINKGKSYISSKLKNKISENNEYKWQLI